jgi:hypothetical protein
VSNWFGQPHTLVLALAWITSLNPLKRDRLRPAAVPMLWLRRPEMAMASALSVQPDQNRARSKSHAA